MPNHVGVDVLRFSRRHHQVVAFRAERTHERMWFNTERRYCLMESHVTVLPCLPPHPNIPFSPTLTAAYPPCLALTRRVNESLMNCNALTALQHARHRRAAARNARA